jgi:hypothetical protein
VFHGEKAIAHLKSAAESVVLQEASFKEGELEKDVTGLPLIPFASGIVTENLSHYIAPLLQVSYDNLQHMNRTSQSIFSRVKFHFA